MTEEPIQQEPTEKVEMFIRGGREVRQYTDDKTGTIRFEGFVVFEEIVKDKMTGMAMHKRHPADFDIHAVDYNEALDRFDQRADETLEEIKTGAEAEKEPQIQTAPAGAEKLIVAPGE